MTVTNQVSQTTSSTLTFDVNCDPGYGIKNIVVIDTSTGTTSSATASWTNDGSCTITGINSNIQIGITVKVVTTNNATINNLLYIPNNQPLENVDINNKYMIIPFTDSSYSEYELFKVYNDNYDGLQTTSCISLPSYVQFSNANGNINPTDIGFWKIVYNTENTGTADDPSYYGIVGVKSSYLNSNDVAVSFYVEPTISITLEGLTDEPNTLANEEHTVPEGCILQGSPKSSSTQIESTTVDGRGVLDYCWSDNDRLGENKVLYSQPVIYYENGYTENYTSMPNNSSYQIFKLPYDTFIQWAGFNAFGRDDSNLNIPDNCEITTYFSSSNNFSIIEAHNTMPTDQYLANIDNFTQTQLNLVLPLNSNIITSSGSVPLELCGISYLQSQNKLFELVFDNNNVPIPIYIKLYKEFDGELSTSFDTLITDMSNSLFNKVPIIATIDPSTSHDSQTIPFNVETLMSADSDYSAVGCILMYFKISDLEAYNNEHYTSYTGFSYTSNSYSNYGLDAHIDMSDEVSEVQNFVIDERSGYQDIENTGYRACILNVRVNDNPESNQFVKITGIQFS